MVSPRARRSAVEGLMTDRGLSQRHACQLVGVHRSTVRYQAHARPDEAATVALIREYAHEQPMYGYRIITAMLKHDGYRINRKRVYRIWRQEGLQLPRRKTAKRRYGDATGKLRRASRCQHRLGLGSSALSVQSGEMQYAQAQQIEFRPPIHLALDELQTIDLPLALSITPIEGYGGAHGVPIPLEA